ncbi:MAG: hypothetical protein ACKPKO_64280 [Candidatus Fonsibacter sp.]
MPADFRVLPEAPASQARKNEDEDEEEEDDDDDDDADDADDDDDDNDDDGGGGGGGGGGDDDDDDDALAEPRDVSRWSPVVRRSSFGRVIVDRSVVRWSHRREQSF